MKAIQMTKREIKEKKEMIRNILRYKPAGQCYKILTELAEEGKKTAIQYGKDREKAHKKGELFSSVPSHSKPKKFRLFKDF